MGWVRTCFFAVTVFSVVYPAKAMEWETAVQRQKVDQKIAEVQAEIQKGPYQADEDSLKNYQVPDWYQNAKFGIFIHWGLYSVPAYANEWYSRNMYQQGDDAFKHHVETYGPQLRFGYKDFIPLFKAEKFDPGHWADLFKDAGAQYVVPVAEHHDGFAMYNSDFSDWTAVKMGPKQDVIGQLSDAFRSRGLVFGASSHRAEHWWFMNGGMKFDSDVQDPKYSDFYGPAEPDDSAPSEEYLRNWLARSCEIVDKYKPQVIYFDWWIGEKPQFKPYVLQFAAYYYDRASEWKKGVVLNLKDKAYIPGASVMDLERGSLKGINPNFWQTDTSLSWGSWGYLKDDHFKPPGSVLDTLIDTVSKNGNLLLNVGPKPDGTLPEEAAGVLREIGAWLRTNGEAVYGTRPWVQFGEGPTQAGVGKFNEAAADYQEGDVRFTRKGGALYVLTLVCPTHPLTITALGEKAQPDITVKKIALLGSPEEVEWKRGREALVIQPLLKPGFLPLAYKLDLDGFAWNELGIKKSDSGLAAQTSMQNYGAKPFEKEFSFSVDGKIVSSQLVTVGAENSASVTFSFETKKPGYYPISISVPGKDPLQGGGAVPLLGLTGEWLFKEGDQSRWKALAQKDSDWQKVQLPAHWEDHSNYTADNVYGWYRKHLSIPVQWKGHGLVLPLGKIDDVDISYFNGHEIGHMGTFPPKMSTAWNQERVYEVPAKWVHFGGDNVISIRVFDGTGGGGLYDGPLGPLDVK